MDANLEQKIRERMASRDIHPDMIVEFLRRVELVHGGYSGKIPWERIGDLSADDYRDLDALPEPADPAAYLKQLVVVKLNGGLGTSMGLSRVKSIISVKDGYTFLQIIRRQIEELRRRYDVPVPLLFMNSFNTREDTLAQEGIAELNKRAGGLPVDFLQNMVPRIHAETHEPIGDGQDNGHWCPPGHGDVFLSLKISGLLDRLLGAGCRVAFLSNGDNLGATVEPRILAHLLDEGLEFASEQTPKTLADLKGGVLYRLLDDAGQPGAIELLETAQVADEHLDDFKDVNRFAYFNTNNIWVHLEALRDRLVRGLPLSLIVNPKQADGTPVLQLETAMGSAIGGFERTRGIVVPRQRFAPVKNCADLMVRRSDVYILRKDDFQLVTNPERKLGEPVVQLGDEYKQLADFDALTPTVPSLLECARLTVSGPVLFDVPVKLKGEVTIRNAGSQPVSIGKAGKTELADETIEL